MIMFLPADAMVLNPGDPPSVLVHCDVAGCPYHFIGTVLPTSALIVSGDAAGWTFPSIALPSGTHTGCCCPQCSRRLEALR